MRLAIPSVLIAGLCLSLPTAAKGPDLASTAEKIVAEVAGVKEGEVVFIDGTTADLSLLNEIYLAVAKHGGLPLLFPYDPKLDRRWYDAVPEKYDGNMAAAAEKLVTIPDVVISLGRVDEPNLMAGVPAARISKVDATWQGFVQKRLARKTRVVGFGNGMFPTKATAKALGIPEADLAKIFWAGVGTDYKALGARADAVRAAVPTGKEIVLQTAAGTELKLKLAAKPVQVSDGVLTADEAKAGGPALMTWLPAGEVYGLVESGSAEGKLVVPRFVWRGQEIKALTITVKAGKDALSILDLGVNADAKPPKGKPLLTFVPAGNVTVFLGNDVWAGGSNKASWSEALFFADATLTADGKPVVDKGVLKVEPTAR